MPRRWPRRCKPQGLDIVSGGTDTHLMLVDLRPKKANGKPPKRRSTAPSSPATRTPFPSTPEKPFVTSGIRLGTPAGTTRGFGAAEFREIGKLIVEVVDAAGQQEHEDGDPGVEASVRDARRRTLPPFPDLSMRGLACAAPFADMTTAR